MMKTISIILGAALCLTGLIGFFNHAFLQMDLNPMHDTFLLIVGAVALYFGTQGTEFQARYLCRAVGVLFILLGGATLIAGAGHATAGGVDIAVDHVLKLIPGHLEYTTADGVRDLATGILGLIAGFFPREKEIQIDMKVQDARLKVGSGR